MRYKIDETTGLRVAETSPDMLAFTVFIALLAGVLLYFLGRYGRQLWLQVWSAGLVGCSILYLVWYFFSR